MSSPELEKLQVNKLNRLLSYASEHVPLFREKICVGTRLPFRNLAQMKELPFLTKEMIREFPEKVKTDEKIARLTKKTTAGSTGEPFVLYKTTQAMAHELAAAWRGYSWAGVDIAERQGRFWGTPLNIRDRFIAKLIDFTANRKRISAFSFDEGSFQRATEELRRFAPDYFYGYLSMLSEYARYFKSRRIPSPFKLKSIITTSEILTPSERELLENIFRTRVFNEYGCGEVGSIAHECGAGVLHVVEENIILEVLDGDRECEPGEVGELVITELNNTAMPLIRYRTGDLGSLSKNRCSCGRVLKGIENICGRAWDMIRHRDGRLFHPAFMLYIFEDAKSRNLGVGNFKTFQLSYDHFKIQIKPEEGYGPDTEKYIAGQIRSKFDQEARIEFEIVDEIERDKSGKIRQMVGMMN